MGLREGEFPRSKNENWIYNDRERAELSGVGVELDNTACAYAEDKFFFAAVAAMATETLTLSWYSDDTAAASAYIEDVERLYAAGCITRSRAGRTGWQEALSEQELLLGLPKKIPAIIGCWSGWEQTGHCAAVSQEFVSKAILFIREFLKTYSCSGLLMKLLAVSSVRRI